MFLRTQLTHHSFQGSSRHSHSESLGELPYLESAIKFSRAVVLTITPHLQSAIAVAFWQISLLTEAFLLNERLVRAVDSNQVASSLRPSGQIPPCRTNRALLATLDSKNTIIRSDFQSPSLVGEGCEVIVKHCRTYSCRYSIFLASSPMASRWSRTRRCTSGSSVMASSPTLPAPGSPGP